MGPTACYDCPDNPEGKEKQKAKDSDTRLIEQYWPEIELSSRLHTSSRLGLLRDTELSESEYQFLSVFYGEWERATRG